MTFGKAVAIGRGQDNAMPDRGGASEQPMPRLRSPVRPAGGLPPGLRVTGGCARAGERGGGPPAEAWDGFPGLLDTRLRRTRRARKGFRTRSALRVAAARSLHDGGYDRLNAADIAASAEVSKATFYVYFRDKAHIAATVLRPFLAYAFPGAACEVPEPDPLQAALACLLPRLRRHRRLLQSLDLMGRDDPDFAAAAQTRILRWHQGLLLRSGRDPDLAPLLAATSLGFAWAPGAGDAGDVPPGFAAEQIARLWRIEARRVSRGRPDPRGGSRS